MSARDHTLIEELMAVAALGGLDPGDEQALERERAEHAPCDECRALDTAFAGIAGRLAFSLDPQPVDMAMADRIIAQGGRVALIPDIGVAPQVPDPPVPPLEDPDRYRANRGRRGRRWAAAVGIAAVLGLAFVASITYLPGLKPVGTHPSAEQRFVRFSGEGELAMAYTPGSNGVVLWGTNLPDPGEGKVYEIWMISGTTPTSGGCVQPTDSAIATYIDANVDGADQMAVTAEPSTCPSAPTSQPFLTASLTV